MIAESALSVNASTAAPRSRASRHASTTSGVFPLWLQATTNARSVRRAGSMRQNSRAVYAPDTTLDPYSETSWCAG